jgi:hypothetical protein
LLPPVKQNLKITNPKPDSFTHITRKSNLL